MKHTLNTGAKAYDEIDGDITANIQISGTVNSSVPGTYEITYNVSNVAGNAASATRTVNVIATPVKQPKSSGASMYLLSLLLLMIFGRRQIQ